MCVRKKKMWKRIAPSQRPHLLLLLRSAHWWNFHEAGVCVDRRRRFYSREALCIFTTQDLRVCVCDSSNASTVCTPNFWRAHIPLENVASRRRWKGAKRERDEKKKYITSNHLKLCRPFFMCDLKNNTYNKKKSCAHICIKVTHFFYIFYEIFKLNYFFQCYFQENILINATVEKLFNSNIKFSRGAQNAFHLRRERERATLFWLLLKMGRAQYISMRRGKTFVCAKGTPH